MLQGLAYQEIKPSGETAVPSSDPNWNYNDPENILERDHLRICVKARLKAIQQKVISYSWVSAITQEPNENLIAFLKTLQKFTNLDLDSYEGQVILKDKFLSQCPSDIRIKYNSYSSRTLLPLYMT